LSVAAIVAGLVSDTDSSARLILAGFAGLLFSCLIPVWIVGTYDSIEAGSHATVDDLARWEFGATWGPLAYAASLVRRMKSEESNRGRSAGP
jgi:hypothetical protein